MGLRKGSLLMSHGVQLFGKQCPNTKEEWKHITKISYALTIGSIKYAMLCTWLNVSYTLSHWSAIKTILKYLRRINDVFLIYKGDPNLRIKGFINASFQSD